MKKHSGKVILAILFLVILRIVFSQSPENISLLVSTEKDVYYKGENITVDVKTNITDNLENSTLELNLIGGNLTFNLISILNETTEFSYEFADLNDGNYTATSILNNNGLIYQNSTEFYVKKTGISYGKTEYMVNETVNLRINALPKTEYNLTISGPLGQVFNITTDESGTYLFTKSFYIPGNYSIGVEDLEFSIEILPFLDEVNLDLLIKETYIINEIIDLKVTGTPYTNYNLVIISPSDTTVFEVNGILDGSGTDLHEMNLVDSGEYLVKIEYQDDVISKVFNIVEKEENFVLSLFKKRFSLDEPVEFSIFGPAVTNVTAEVKGGNQTLAYGITTDSDGLFLFSSYLEPSGNYTVSLIADDSVVVTDNFEIYEENISAIEEGNVTVIEKEVPYIIEEEPEMDGVYWKKNVTVKNVSSVPYENFTLSLEIPESLAEIEIFEYPGNEIQNFTIQQERNKTKIEWVIDVFNETKYYITGIINITEEVIDYDEDASEIFIDSLPFNAMNGNAHYYLTGDLTTNGDGVIFSSKTNITLDCQGYKITGSNARNGITVENSFVGSLINCNVEGFKIGVLFKRSQTNVLDNNIITGNEEGAIFLNSNGNTVINNVMTENSGQGLLFYSSFVNEVKDNVIESNLGKSTLDIIEKLDEKN